MQLSVGARSDVGMIRAGNEDNFCADTNESRGLFVVADGLSSKARWQVLANQVMVAQLTRGPREAPAYSMDKWDGYVAARERLLAILAEPVLKHRMALTFAARAEGESASGVINRLAAALG